MTNPAAPLDPADDVARALADLMPRLRQTSRTALGIMLVSVLVTAFLAVLTFSSGMSSKHQWDVATFVIILGVVAVVGAYKWAVSTQETLVMPVLAGSIGLHYGKNAKGFVDGLPKRLLPDRHARSGEDHLIGQLGAHRIQMAEVQVETGGKNSKILFRGIVAQFPNSTAMPAFFMARQDETMPGFFSGGRLSTEGLHHLRDVQIGTRTYGIWTSTPDGPEPRALSDVVEVLRGLEVRVGSGVELYAATSNGVEMHVALSHKRNLFRAGGLFPDEARIFADVQRAMQDLKIPLTLAQALIEAEEAAVEKVKGA